MPTTILAIEDAPAALELLAARLGGGGCRVVAVKTSTEALEAARAQDLDLALAELSLQGDVRAGIAVIRGLRELQDQGGTRRFPIVVHSVTVRYQSELPVEPGLVDAHLPKPCTGKELQALVTRLSGLPQRRKGLPGGRPSGSRVQASAGRAPGLDVAPTVAAAEGAEGVEDVVAGHRRAAGARLRLALVGVTGSVQHG